MDHSKQELTLDNLKKLKEDGASYVTGSLIWHNTYTPMQEAESKRIRELIWPANTSFADTNKKTYLIRLKDIIH